MNLSIASGKGGTGKTTVSINLAAVAQQFFSNITLLDCDVEAPDCQLFLDQEISLKSSDVVVKTPKILIENCSNCGKCVKNCHYNALAKVNDSIIIFEELCHSCGMCSMVCRDTAITKENRKIGKIHNTKIADKGFNFANGDLNVGEVLTTKVIAQLKEDFCDSNINSLNIIDCPPGTSCPAVESFLDTDKVILVTEPTPFGLNDLKLAINLTAELKLPVAIVINKSDGIDTIIEEYAKEISVPIIGRIPFKKDYAKAYSAGKILVEEFSEVKGIFCDIIQKIPKINTVANISNKKIKKQFFHHAFTSANSENFQEITILSGKGGTGKTTVTASFAALAKNSVIADTDVDAANMHLMNNAKLIEQKDFFSGLSCQIDQDKCLQCGKCIQFCQFDAIENNNNNQFKINNLKCDGCGVCEYICKSNAIITRENLTGTTKLSATDYGPLIHANLNTAEDNTGKLVTEVRKQATQLAKFLQQKYLIVDGPPGIGCPVIASLTNSNCVVLVTEPTVSGIHDLERIIKLCKHFELLTYIIINKADINIEKAIELKKLAKIYSIEVIAEIPFDRNISKLLTQGKTPMHDKNNPIAKVLTKAWKTIIK
ncbi:P-loop NTPase [Lentisphaerota bacterium WC36G]|nr:P-loop NTPase [Lentisphaerae bacterium WC36]